MPEPNKNLQTHTDEELVKLYQKTESLDILGKLFNRYVEWIYGICLKYFKNSEESQDVGMEVFELLIKRLPGKEIDHFKAWLYRVVSNYCLDALRKKKSLQEKTSSIQHMYSDAIFRHDDEGQELEYQLKMMEECIDLLNPEQKQSVDLFYLQKKSYQEVADVMRITWSQTRSFIQNGRRNLKLCMEDKV